MSSQEVPHSVESEGPEQDVMSSSGQTFIQAPEVAAYCVISESPEQDVMPTGGQMYSMIQDIEACSNQTMYQPPPQIAPQSMSQPQPEISNTHEGETSQYFIIHCQHGSCSEPKFSIFYFCFVVLSPITLAVSHPVHKTSQVSKENYA